LTESLRSSSWISSDELSPLESPDEAPDSVTLPLLFCHWRVVEPRPGQFEWHDAEINALRSRGFMILANLGHPPLWAGQPHPKEQDHGTWTSAPPRDVKEWETTFFAPSNITAITSGIGKFGTNLTSFLEGHR
jgi:hypothetical protein